MGKRAPPQKRCFFIRENFYWHEPKSGAYWAHSKIHAFRRRSPSAL